MLNVTLLIFSIYFICMANSLQCMDHNNNTVDWYVLYKLPHMQSANASKFVRSGFAYTFITSSNLNPWKLSTIAIASVNSIVSLTLLPLYGGNVNDLIYILYNDEPPNKKINNNKGHTKGVVIGSDGGGLWLIHSVPKFPPMPQSGSYDYPISGSVYGQSFLCISLNADVNVDFTATHDHSKWAVSSDDRNYWVCIGDINRADTQLHRGGGTVCMLNKLVATSFK